MNGTYFAVALGIIFMLWDKGKKVINGQVSIGLPFMVHDSSGAFDHLYRKHGQLKKVEWQLLKALAIVESSERANAVNPADPSYGLMQVLCGKPKPGGGWEPCDSLDDRCQNRLYIRDWPPQVKQLLEPDFNLHIASQILAYNVNRYGMLKGVACYNDWSARHSDPAGPFPNQAYVQKVMAEYNRLQPD